MQNVKFMRFILHFSMCAMLNFFLHSIHYHCLEVAESVFGVNLANIQYLCTWLIRDHSELSKCKREKLAYRAAVFSA